MYRLKLRDLREDADIKQVEMAKILNCTQTCYSKWELEQRDIPIKTLIQIANYFNVSLDYVCGLTHEKKPFPKS